MDLALDFVTVTEGKLAEYQYFKEQSNEAGVLVEHEQDRFEAVAYHRANLTSNSQQGGILGSKKEARRHAS